MIAITAKDKGEKALLDARFGRCAFLVFYNEDKNEFTTKANPARAQGGGSGINAAQYLSEHGVEVLLTGNVGPKALMTLQAAGITVYTGAQGTVQDAVAAYKAGKLKRADRATVRAHYGTDGPQY